MFSCCASGKLDLYSIKGSGGKSVCLSTQGSFVQSSNPTRIRTMFPHMTQHRLALAT